MRHPHNIPFTRRYCCPPPVCSPPPWAPPPATCWFAPASSEPEPPGEPREPEGAQLYLWTPSAKCLGSGAWAGQWTQHSGPPWGFLVNRENELHLLSRHICCKHSQTERLRKDSKRSTKHVRQVATYHRNRLGQELTSTGSSCSQRARSISNMPRNWIAVHRKNT